MKKKILVFVLIIFSCCFNLNILGASDKEEELFFVAQKAFEDGFYDVALSYLERFLSDYPQTTFRPKIYLLKGKCYLYQTQYLKALEQFQIILDMPQSQDIRDAALFWLAEVHFRGEDYKLATDYYSKLISEFPNSGYLAYAYYSLGWSLFEQGEFEEAIKYYERLIKDYPAHELVDEANFKIAESLYNLKKYTEAEEYLNVYITKFPETGLIDQSYFYLGESNYYQERFDEASKNYLKVIDVSKDNKMISLAKTGLGWSYLKLKKYDEAKLSLQEAKELAKDNNFALDLILLGEATVLNELGNYTEVLELYQQLITSFPESELLPDAYFGKANSLYALGREIEAIPIYEKVIEQSKGNIDKVDLVDKAHFGLAWIYLKLNRFDEAIAQFQAVVDTTTDKTTKISALCQIADAYQNVNALQKALDVYDKILKDYPESFYSDYVQYQEGIILLKLEKIDAATIALQSLKTNFPKSKYITDAQYYLALAYFKKGDFIWAKTQLEDLLKGQNNESSYKQEATFLLGMTLYNLEKYRDAIDTYRIIIKNFSDNKELVQKAEYEMANCLFRIGKPQDALKKFKIIVYKFPKSNIALEALNWLGEYYLKMHKFDMARRYLQKIIADFPENEIIDKVHYEIGKSYYKEARFNEALEEFNIVKEISKDKLAGLASLDIVDILSQTENDKDSVIKGYNDIITQYPNLAKEAQARLGQFYSFLDNYDKAIDAFQGALNSPSGESDVQDSQLQFNIAEAFEEKGDLDKAIETYLKVTYLYPKDELSIKSYLRIARIFENRENWNEAKKIYEKIIKEEAEESKFAQERLDWIKENIGD